MVRITALIASLLAAPVISETVDVRGRGPVDLKTFECRDITRSTIVQRVCYDAARRHLLVAVKNVFDQYCNVPPETFAAFMNAPSMGFYFNRSINGNSSSDRYECKAYQLRG